MFAVVGAGAIGAYVGAALARGGGRVTLIARGEHLRAMQADGVQVLSPRGDFLAHPAATDDWDVISEADVVFVGLKAYSLPEHAERLASLIRPGVPTIWAQNGVPWWFFHSFPGELEGSVIQAVDPDGVIAASIAADHVVGCVVYCSTEIVRPGVIRHIEGTRVAIGEPDGTISTRCRAISEAFVAGGLRCPVDADLRGQIWLKVIGNVGFNTVSALTGATLEELGSRPETVELLREVLRECAEVGQRLGIELPVSLERRLQAGFDVGEHKTSMLQDLEAGKPLEIGCLSGAVIELAHRLGVPTPHTQSVHACVTLLDSLRSRTGSHVRDRN
jgi:2-dehydropantoate 2-reductase